jgi:hypothetical protein
MKTRIFLLLLMLWSFSSNGQSILPILEANSKIIDVKEDGMLRKGNWEVSPNIKTDTYFTKRFKKTINITFYSDLDSLTFTLSPNQTIDFIILLNGKDTCRTQIRSLKGFKKVDSKAPAIIPFTIGRDNRIYLHGSINNSESIKIMYDTGAEGTGLAKAAINNQVKINFDGNGITSGSGGIIASQTSNINKIQIGNLVWDDELIATVNKKLGLGALAIVGYSLFSDKIVEINYDKKILIIHDEVPDLIGFQKIESKWLSYVPDIKTKIRVGKKEVAVWILFDTGASGTLFVNKEFMTKQKLYGQMEKLAEAVSTGIGPQSVRNETIVLPEISLINHTFQNLPITVEAESNNISLVGNLIGMDLLKRFNTIIDYQNNAVYFQANGLYNQPFKKPITNTQFWLIGLALSVLVILMIWYFIRKRITK